MRNFLVYKKRCEIQISHLFFHKYYSAGVSVVSSATTSSTAGSSAGSSSLITISLFSILAVTSSLVLAALPILSLR